MKMKMNGCVAVLSFWIWFGLRAVGGFDGWVNAWQGFGDSAVVIDERQILSVTTRTPQPNAIAARLWLQVTAS